MTGWVGVDLDGTLASYDGWNGHTQIGTPVPAMVERVQRWIGEGRHVKIFTARVSTPDEKERDEVVSAIQAWCQEHVGVILPITCSKDFGMIELWDDRVVQVIPNTGQPIGFSTRGLDEQAPEATE